MPDDAMTTAPFATGLAAAGLAAHGLAASGPVAPVPARMRAIAIAAPGGPEALVEVERPVPEPRPGEILIAVAAAGVNRPDLLQRSGAYPPPPGASDLPGLEVAGRVAAVGPGPARWRVGDAVTALVPGGGYAEYCVTPGAHALPVPDGFGWIEAASLPETAFTVWVNVMEHGALRPGETLLVHGGTSGIGVMAIQMAAAFGARVFATAGTAEKCAACLALGAEGAFDHRRQDFVAELARATGGRGADVILDMVGGDYIARNHQAAAERGRIVQIAFLRGPKAELDLRPVMMKRLVHTGSTLRPRSIAEKAAIADALARHVWPRLRPAGAADGIRPVIHAVFPLVEAKAAHELMEAGTHVGKIMLAVA
jgi:NADPH2:quinone reductase